MRKRIRSFSAISRHSRAMVQPLRNIKRRLLMSGVIPSPRLDVRSLFRRRRIVDTGSVHLTRFRQVTHLPKTGRVSSQSGPRFGVKLPNLHSSLPHLDAKGVERIRQSLPALTESDMQKICHDRKVRREVMFAKGVSGGSHRPPTYNFKSLVRCSK